MTSGSTVPLANKSASRWGLVGGFMVTGIVLAAILISATHWITRGLQDASPPFRL